MSTFELKFFTLAWNESLYRRLRLKAHFHNNGDSDFRSTRRPDINDPFAKFNPKVYTWTPPDGKFSAVDHFIDRCRRAVSALDFKARTQNSNLSRTERRALLQLSKRSAIMVVQLSYGRAFYTSPRLMVNCRMLDFINT